MSFVFQVPDFESGYNHWCHSSEPSWAQVILSVITKTIEVGISLFLFFVFCDRHLFSQPASKRTAEIWLLFSLHRKWHTSQTWFLSPATLALWLAIDRGERKKIWFNQRSQPQKTDDAGEAQSKLLLRGIENVWIEIEMKELNGTASTGSGWCLCSYSEE